ncbi:hypothetical protein D3C86_1806400 [compost metagenome]
MKNRVRKRKFHHGIIREHFFQFFADIFVHSIIVIDMQKTSAKQVISQVFGFRQGKDHVPVPCHVNERIQAQFRASDIDVGCFFRNSCS